MKMSKDYNDIDVKLLKEENEKLKAYVKKYRKDIINMSNEILELRMIADKKQTDFIEIYNTNIDFALKILNNDKNKPDIVLADVKNYLEETRI